MRSPNGRCSRHDQSHSAARNPGRTRFPWASLSFSLEDCVVSGSLAPGTAQLLSRMIEAKLAFLISGGTGSGKLAIALTQPEQGELVRDRPHEVPQTTHGILSKLISAATYRAGAHLSVTLDHGPRTSQLRWPAEALRRDGAENPVPGTGGWAPGLNARGAAPKTLVAAGRPEDGS